MLVLEELTVVLILRLHLGCALADTSLKRYRRWTHRGSLSRQSLIVALRLLIIKSTLLRFLEVVILVLEELTVVLLWLNEEINWLHHLATIEAFARNAGVLQQAVVMVEVAATW